jgi:galactonate dehydratase
VRPDVCHCGGITELMKIAANAETHYVNVVPHNNAGPLGSAASLHASLAIANIELMEAPFANRDNTHTNICGPFPIVENGYALPLNGPGLGIEFDEEAAANTPFKAKQMPNLNAIDGSIRDW